MVERESIQGAGVCCLQLRAQSALLKAGWGLQASCSGRCLLGLWRAVLLSARAGLAPVTAETCDKADHAEVLKPWVASWRLVVRLASTCKALHSALLGLEAGQLWEWACLISPQTWYHVMWLSIEDAAGVGRLQLRQARHAKSALLLAGPWPASQLETAAASLTSVETLLMHYPWSQDAAAVALSALPSQPRCLCFHGVDIFPACASLQALTQLSLHVWGFNDAGMRGLAGWLPRLQRFELGHTGQYSRGLDLRLLHILPAAELCVHLSIRGASVELWQQLATLRLHTLEL